MSMRYLPFGTSIDQQAHMVPAGMSPPKALRRVQVAVQALPSALVDYGGLVPPGLPWLRLYEPGCCVPRDDGMEA